MGIRADWIQEEEVKPRHIESQKNLLLLFLKIMQSYCIHKKYNLAGSLAPQQAFVVVLPSSLLRGRHHPRVFSQGTSEEGAGEGGGWRSPSHTPMDCISMQGYVISTFAASPDSQHQKLCCADQHPRRPPTPSPISSHLTGSLPHPSTEPPCHLQAPHNLAPTHRPL